MWPLIGSHGQRATGVIDPSISLGITVSAAPNNAKGAWTQLHASTPHETSWLGVYLDFVNVASTRCLVDLGVGPAGAERVLVANLFAGNYAAFSPIWLPVQIPAGSRIAARAQTNNTQARNLQVSLMLLRSRWSWDCAGQGVDTYGANLGTTDGTTVTGGAANTQGAWTQIVDATARAHESLLVASRYINNGVIEIGLGPSGSEQSLTGEFTFARASCGASHVFYHWLPIGVPEGARLVARFRSSTANGQTAIVIYGF